MLEFIVLALACWRITSLLYREHWLDWLRKLAGVVHDENGPAMYPTKASQFFECFWCLTLIVALPLSFLSPVRWWASWLAFSAAAIWLETRTGHFQVRS